MGHPVEGMFEDVYVEMPSHLRSQLEQLRAELKPAKEGLSILSFAEASQRAAG